MEYRQLPGSDLRVSTIGFGASPLGNEFGAIDASEGERAVHHAIDRGITVFDVSPYYGRTLAEERLGAALKGKRNQIVLATKCGRYDTQFFDFSASRVTASCDESLQRLGTDYLDILHAHDIEFGDRNQILNETIPALQKLKQAGKVRLIGITGYPLGPLADVSVRANVDVVMSYCRYNLLTRDLDVELVPSLEHRGIGLFNASPLYMGVLTESGAPSWHPAPEPVKEAGKKIVELYKARGLSITAEALRFCLDHPYVSSTFVGMSTPAQVDENLKAFQLRTDSAFIAEVEAIAGPALNMTWKSGHPENNP
jgi:L-galactose dehydrogenase